MHDVENKLLFSALPKTWILDLDGTIVKHNGYKLDGHDSFLPGAREFLMNIPPCDMIVFLTSRKSSFALQTENFFHEQGIRYDHIIYNAPYGERILVNDDKPSGLKMSYAVCISRDTFSLPEFQIDEAL